MQFAQIVSNATYFRNIFVYLNRVFIKYVMNQNPETTLKQSSSYAAPVVDVVEIDLSQVICQSNSKMDHYIDFDPETDEMP